MLLVVPVEDDASDLAGATQLQRGTVVAKLLVVEDNMLLRDVLTRRLSRDGFQVTIASHGNEAIARARAEQPDLILVDLDQAVPGWQTVTYLRTIAETCTIPILVLVGRLPAQIRQQLLAARCDVYETKPINFAQLAARIRWLTSGSYGLGMTVGDG